jgi:hypothetical protein
VLHVCGRGWVLCRPEGVSVFLFQGLKGDEGAGKGDMYGSSLASVSGACVVSQNADGTMMHCGSYVNIPNTCNLDM